MLVSTWIATVSPGAELDLGGVDGADDVVEAERPQPPLELVGRVAGHEHAGCRGGDARSSHGTSK